MRCASEPLVEEDLRMWHDLIGHLTFYLGSAPITCESAQQRSRNLFRFRGTYVLGLSLDGLFISSRRPKLGIIECAQLTGQIWRITWTPAVSNCPKFRVILLYPITTSIDKHGIRQADMSSMNNRLDWYCVDPSIIHDRFCIQDASACGGTCWSSSNLARPKAKALCCPTTLAHGSISYQGCRMTESRHSPVLWPKPGSWE